MLSDHPPPNIFDALSPLLSVSQWNCLTLSSVDGSVRENVLYVFFRFQKRDYLRIFEMVYQKAKETKVWAYVYSVYAIWILVTPSQNGGSEPSSQAEICPTQWVSLQTRCHVCDVKLHVTVTRLPTRWTQPLRGARTSAHPRATHTITVTKFHAKHNARHLLSAES